MDANESADRVIVFDTTLRDGEQAPGASMNLAQKLQVARALAALGVDVMEVGFPVASPGDFQAVEAIARQVEGPSCPHFEPRLRRLSCRTERIVAGRKDCRAQNVDRRA